MSRRAPVCAWLSPCSPFSLFTLLSAAGRRSLPLQIAAQLIAEFAVYKGACWPCCCSQLLSWLTSQRDCVKQFAGSADGGRWS